MKPAVFLDRDGVLNELVFNEDTEQIDSPFSVEQFVLIDGVKEAVKLIKEMGFLVIVVTNQPAAAKGKTTVEAIEKVNLYLQDKLEGSIDAIYCCYHFPRRTILTKRDDLIIECDCRKPKPGLLIKAASEHSIDLSKSFMVGDSYTDILAGQRAGVKTVFVGNFKCDVCNMLGNKKPDIIVSCLKEFSDRLDEYIQ